jgi:hypothetical protein
MLLEREASVLPGALPPEAAETRPTPTPREHHRVSTWNLTERLAVDLHRVASALCRPIHGR